MKVYIAGKITGTTDYKERFGDAAKKIELNGDIPLNPAAQPEGMSAEDYMSMCLPMLLRADAVALLPDWETSPGARIEKALAEYCGKRIIELDEKKNSIDVVKCKECIHIGLDRTCGMGLFGTTGRVSREFFCAFGKRK